MTQRKAAVRAHVERVNAELAQVVDRLNQEDWHMTTTSEAWPIGYAVRHQADPEAIHAGNAAGLATCGAGAPEEVLTTLLQAHTRGHLDSIRATAAAEVSTT